MTRVVIKSGVFEDETTTVPDASDLEQAVRKARGFASALVDEVAQGKADKQEVESALEQLQKKFTKEVEKTAEHLEKLKQELVSRIDSGGNLEIVFRKITDTHIARIHKITEEFREKAATLIARPEHATYLAVEAKQTALATAERVTSIEADLKGLHKETEKLGAEAGTSAKSAAAASQAAQLAAAAVAHHAAETEKALGQTVANLKKSEAIAGDIAGLEKSVTRAFREMGPLKDHSVQAAAVAAESVGQAVKIFGQTKAAAEAAKSLESQVGKHADACRVLHEQIQQFKEAAEVACAASWTGAERCATDAGTAATQAAAASRSALAAAEDARLVREALGLAKEIEPRCEALLGQVKAEATRGEELQAKAEAIHGQFELAARATADQLSQALTLAQQHAALGAELKKSTEFASAAAKQACDSAEVAAQAKDKCELHAKECSEARTMLEETAPRTAALAQEIRELGRKVEGHLKSVTALHDSVTQSLADANNAAVAAAGFKQQAEKITEATLHHRMVAAEQAEAARAARTRLEALLAEKHDEFSEKVEELQKNLTLCASDASRSEAQLLAKIDRQQKSIKALTIACALIGLLAAGLAAYLFSKS